MNERTGRRKGGFVGNPDHLQRLLRLIGTPIRSDERGQALEEWSAYKKHLGRAFVRANKPRRRRARGFTKADYIRSLTAPAVDLRGATLRGVCLGYVDLRGVRLDGARFLPPPKESGKPIWTALKGARLERASLRHVYLRGARLLEADLRGADLTGANLVKADLTGANLAGANLGGARLTEANLERASLMGADLRGADLRGARVYGVATWDVNLCEDESLRRGLIVTPDEKPPVKVDNLEVAQFIHVLLAGLRLGSAFDALGRKGVLILGRFTPERKQVLDALREKLREHDLVPVIFDFERPESRDLTEMVRLLAGISRFIIADITNPRSSPLELQATVPEYMIPFVPIIQAGEQPFPMFKDLWVKHSQWVLDPLEYDSAHQLMNVIEPAILEPAMRLSSNLTRARARPLRTRRTAEYL